MPIGLMQELLFGRINLRGKEKGSARRSEPNHHASESLLTEFAEEGSDAEHCTANAKQERDAHFQWNATLYKFRHE